MTFRVVCINQTSTFDSEHLTSTSTLRWEDDVNLHNKGRWPNILNFNRGSHGLINQSVAVSKKILKLGGIENAYYLTLVTIAATNW